MTDPQLAQLKKATLVRLAEAALAALPPARRVRILAEYLPDRTPQVRQSNPTPEGRRFLQQVRTFVQDSLAEKYYDARPRKDARGWPEDPPLTGVWCRRAQALCVDMCFLLGDPFDWHADSSPLIHCAVGCGRPELASAFDPTECLSYEFSCPST